MKDKVGVAKVSLSFDTYFENISNGNRFKNLPPELIKLFGVNDDVSMFSDLKSNLEPGTNYRITISIEQL